MQLRSLPRVRLALAFAVCAGASACSGEEPSDNPDAAKDTADTAETTAESAESDDGANVEAVAPETVADDTPDAGDVEAEALDAAGSDLDDGGVADVPDSVDVAQCVTGTDCDATAMALKACQQPVCIDGACKAATKPDACCADADCADKAQELGGECVVGKCDVAASTCTFAPILNCCSGKVTLLKTSFETNPLDELKAQEGPQNGAGAPGYVAWAATTARVHSGKQALYFGNACKTYDTTMTPETGCKPATGAAPVSTVLTTKEYPLPKDKKAHLHFWLWLDSEPPYSETLPKGDCKIPCAAGSACIQVNGQSQCVPEKDVLTVSVLVGETATTVFDSTSIGKSTKGNWLHVAADLTKWHGQAIKVQWAFATGTGLKNQYEGVYLDDVVIETNCADKGAFCGTGGTCADDGNACTLDACTKYTNNPEIGICFGDKKPGCCSSQSECDDGLACTIDSCVLGQCQLVPDASKPGCCKTEVLFPEDFDAGVLDQWDPPTSNSPTVKWRIHPQGGIGPDGQGVSQALYFGGEAFESYADATLGKDVGPMGTICTKAIKLKQGTLHDLLTFDVNLETEWSGLPAGAYKNPPIGGSKKYDVLSVGVLASGVTPTEVWSSDAVAGTTEGKWVPVTAALDAYQGKTVKICFTFDAGDAQANDKLGPRIDNVLAKVACSKKPCYFDIECKALQCGACKVALCTKTGCACQKIPECCVEAKDCDDGESKCTVDMCGANGKCVHELTLAEGCTPTQGN